MSSTKNPIQLTNITLMKHFAPIFILLIFTSSQIIAQEEHTTHEAHHFQHHGVALFTGYGLIQGAVDENGQKKTKIIPVIGVDYVYFFNHKFGVGILNDLELSSYSVEQDNQEYLARNYAFVSTVVFLYEPIIGWALFAGPGYEFEKDHGFPLVKIGSELSKNFQDGWSVGVGVSYDIKEVNSSFSFGLTAGKKFGK